MFPLYSSVTEHSGASHFSSISKSEVRTVVILPGATPAGGFDPPKNIRECVENTDASENRLKIDFGII